MVFLFILLPLDLVFLIGAIIFTKDSVREQELRAMKIGYIGIALMVLLGVFILFSPGLRWSVVILFAILVLLLLLCLIPGRPNPQALKGTEGYLRGEVKRGRRYTDFITKCIPKGKREMQHGELPVLH
jgi:cell division protein FtsW (lipid II flippase)